MFIAEEWDQYDDLTPSQMSSVQEWEIQFSERYDFVGKLVKDGEEGECEDEGDAEEPKSDEVSFMIQLKNI